MSVKHTAVVLSDDSARLLSAMAGHFLGMPHEHFYCREVIIEHEPIDLSVYPLGAEVEFHTTEVVGDDRAQVAALAGFSPDDLPFMSQPFVAVSTVPGVTQEQAGHLLRRYSGDRRAYRVGLVGRVAYWNGTAHKYEHPTWRRPWDDRQTDLFEEA